MELEQIIREFAALEKFFNARILAVEDEMKVHYEALTRVPTDVDKQISHTREVVNERFATMVEKFASISLQFQERDTRTEQTSKDSKVAVDAALQAAKEAVGEQNKSSALAIAKSEASTTKQIEQITTNIGSINENLNDKIEDVKARVSTLATKDNIRGEGADDNRANLAIVISVITGVVTMGSVILSRLSPSSPGSMGTPQIVYVPGTTPVPVPGAPLGNK